MANMSAAEAQAEPELAPAPRWRIKEDWLAILVGAGLLVVVLGIVTAAGEMTADGLTHPLKGQISKPGEWDSSPLEGMTRWSGIVAAWLVLGVAGLAAALAARRRLDHFVPGMLGVLALATLAYVLAGQAVVKHYNLEYAIWALGIGLLISNTVGTPRWLASMSLTEFYIKTGLVLLGAEVLFGRLMALGLPGVCVAWVVTPIVLITTFWFGQRVLRIESPTLNMVISADMSVCGVSAAIATAAACRAKKEELSLAISLSLMFTVVMMVIMPAVIRWTEMSSVVGGAWMGGTIDSSGAVAAAGSMLDSTALEVAVTVKMIQNILIGVVAFGVAWYWVRYRDVDAAAHALEPSAGAGEIRGPRPGIAEIWRRFPRFIIGFVVASILFSLLAGSGTFGEALATSTTGVTKTLRGWFFCLAFVSIGLETNFRMLAHQLRGGKPIVLYLVGQSLNLCLTLFMAWLMFTQVFPHWVAAMD
ncbi:YeiH family protein [Candidatus Laterigemmans baculatus]|uniref:YeiH family protein n=1 Tax=Candidatus Laterigemmans baculatus TaxID=2770505 RepID=UPI0013DC76A5|nr:putative sulfate exporter family transporter [Candidatus Laterigemmans baculatus]